MGNGWWHHHSNTGCFRLGVMLRTTPVALRAWNLCHRVGKGYPKPAGLDWHRVGISYRVVCLSSRTEWATIGTYRERGFWDLVF